MFQGLLSLLSTLLGVLAGFVAGVISVQLFAPDLLRGSEEASVPSEVTARIFAAGNIRGADDLRRAQGRAQWLDAGRIQILRLTNFEVTPGPDVRVLLSRADRVADGDQIRLAQVLDAGALQGFTGDQTIVLPEGLNPDDFSAVLLWDAEFRQLYAVAELER